ncbi:MAG TPA: hypothetical protein VGB31_03000, partial [Myxococcota bacterium]
MPEVPRLMVEFATNAQDIANKIQAAHRQVGQSSEKLVGVTDKVATEEKKRLFWIQRTIEKLDPMVKATRVYQRDLENLKMAQDKLGLSTAQYNRLAASAKAQMDAAGGSASKYSGILARLGPMIAATFSIGALVRWTRSLLDAELQLVKFEKRFLVATGGDKG